MSTTDNIIRSTIKKSYKHWKPCKQIRCWHFCGCFDGTKMICFTKNNPVKTHAGAYRIGENFNLPKYKEYPFFHSESRLIDRLLSKYNYIDPAWKVVVMRINRCGKIFGSKPCINCNKLLKVVGLDQIYYSTDTGSFIGPNNNIIHCKPYLFTV
jgi:hypothetical protein